MKQETKKSAIEIKVISINTLYKYSKEIIEYEKKHFNQFLGKNIVKVDGSIKQKYQHEKLTFKGKLNDGTYYDVHYWFDIRSGWFDINIKICVNGGSYDTKPSTAFCQYDSLMTSLYKLDSESNLLPYENDLSYLDNVYNVADLSNIANDIKEAAIKYNKETDKMPYIFKDVFFIERLSR